MVTTSPQSPCHRVLADGTTSLQFDFSPVSAAKLPEGSKFVRPHRRALRAYAAHDTINELMAYAEGLVGADALDPGALAQGTTLTWPPVAPHISTANSAPESIVTFVGGSSVANSERTGVQLDPERGVLVDVPRDASKKSVPQPTLISEYRRALFDVGMDDAQVEGLPQLFSSALKDAWGAGRVNSAVADEIRTQLKAAAKDSEKLTTFATQGPEEADAEVADTSVERLTLCSPRPDAKALGFFGQRSGRWRESKVGARCKTWRCPQCGRIRARKEMLRLQAQWKRDRVAARPWWHLLVLTAAPPKDGRIHTQARKLRRVLGSRVIPALKKALGAELDVYYGVEFTERGALHANLVLRSKSLGQAMLTETKLAAVRDLVALARSQPGRDSNDQPLFLASIPKLTTKVRDIVTKYGWGPSLSLRPLRDPATDCGEVTKWNQRVGKRIPRGMRLFGSSKGFFVEESEQDRKNVERRASADEEREVREAIAGYVDQLPGCPRGDVGLRSSTTPEGLAYSAPPPGSILAKERREFLAERRAEEEARFTATRREAPRRKEDDVLQYAYSTPGMTAADLSEWQGEQCGVRFGGRVDAMGRVGWTFSTPRVLDSVGDELRAVAEYVLSLRRWCDDREGRADLDLWIQNMTALADWADAGEDIDAFLEQAA